jgi:hypothetical protein
MFLGLLEAQKVITDTMEFDTGKKCGNHHRPSIKKYQKAVWLTLKIFRL